MKGFYNTVTSNIYKLSSQDIFVRVVSVVDNIKEISNVYKIVQRAKELGAKSYAFTLPVSFGKGRNLYYSEVSKEEYELIVKTIAELEKEYPDFVETANTIQKKYDKIEPNCGAGHRSVTISPDNKIRICPMVNEALGSIGDASKMNYIDIFKNPFILDYEKLNSPSEKYCSSCKWIFYCRGCISRALSKIADIGVENCKWINYDETAKFLQQKNFNKIPKKNVYCVKSHLD